MKKRKYKIIYINFTEQEIIIPATAPFEAVKLFHSLKGNKPIVSVTEVKEE